MSNKNTTIKLNTGADFPVLGFGTFLSEPNVVGNAVREALEVGYRHIDCAAAYDNEKEIGEALAKAFKDGVCKREEVFITSKLRQTHMTPDKLKESFDQTLKDLQLDYLNLYLIHTPIPSKKNDDDSWSPIHGGFGLQDLWRKMEEIYNSGKAKAIGISNFPTVPVNDMLGYAKVKPAVNQIERHPYLPQEKHVKFCNDYNIQITEYSPLGNPGMMSKDKPDEPNLIDNKVIKKIADKHKKSPAQVLIRWGIQCGCAVIPKSTKSERIKENFDIWDFKLDDNEMKEINNIHKETSVRYFDQDYMGVPVFT